MANPERQAGDARTLLQERLHDGLRRVDLQVRRLRRAHGRLVTASLMATALATVLAGMAAATGPVAGEGPGAWRLTCAAIAVLTAAAGLLTGLHQRLGVAESLTRARTCAGRLRALEIGLTLTGRPPDDVARDYEEVVATYQEFVAG